MEPLHCGGSMHFWYHQWQDLESVEREDSEERRVRMKLAQGLGIYHHGGCQEQAD